MAARELRVNAQGSLYRLSKICKQSVCVCVCVCVRACCACVGAACDFDYRYVKYDTKCFLVSSIRSEHCSRPSMNRASANKYLYFTFWYAVSFS